MKNSSLPQPEASLKNHFGNCDNKEDRAHQRIQTEERDIDPIEAAAPGDKMFEHDAQNNDDPADDEGEPESTKQAEAEKQSAHDYVRQERGLQGILRSPGNHQ